MTDTIRGLRVDRAILVPVEINARPYNLSLARAPQWNELVRRFHKGKL